MVSGVRDARSRCPRGQIELGLVNLHGLEAVPMKGKYIKYVSYVKTAVFCDVKN